MTEITTGCLVGLGNVELQCIPPEKACFVSKNFFTANGDGVNDFWSLKPIKDGCDYSLSICDRYGKLLCRLNPINDKWDGAFQGVIMPSSGSWFVVNYIDGTTTKTLQSHFTLKR